PRILTSMLKRIDTAIYDFTAAMIEGNEPSGGRKYDLSDEGVGYSTSGGFVDDITGELDDYAQRIIDGEIEVPTAPGRAARHAEGARWPRTSVRGPGLPPGTEEDQPVTQQPEQTASTAGGTYAVRVRGVGKRFPGVVANHDVS